ncbi:PH domain-containing protein [Halovenus rubra]|uniref:PH domain-containing protein n=2 Tax=Halovenus rubra TaxID=869890 RepID=A0ABD5XGP4_9EURY|nr:PH domain-containing protein [Halovenus rubra]
MSRGQLESYLASDEELLLVFIAESVVQGKDGQNGNHDFSESEYTFGATDRRVVYLTESGGFKDIDYQHVSSIETEVEEDNSDQGTV